MPVDFRQRAAALERQLAQVQADLALAEPPQKLRLEALRASLLRSLRWYRARAGTRTDIHALQVRLHEDVQTAEAGV